MDFVVRPDRGVAIGVISPVWMTGGFLAMPKLLAEREKCRIERERLGYRH